MQTQFTFICVIVMIHGPVLKEEIIILMYICNPYSKVNGCLLIFELRFYTK